MNQQEYNIIDQDIDATYYKDVQKLKESNLVGDALLDASQTLRKAFFDKHGTTFEAFVSAREKYMGKVEYGQSAKKIQPHMSSYVEQSSTSSSRLPVAIKAVDFTKYVMTPEQTLQMKELDSEGKDLASMITDYWKRKHAFVKTLSERPNAQSKEGSNDAEQ